jgi:hypothetical protein
VTPARQPVCPACLSPADASGDFCPRCGTLFIDGVTCERHPAVPALGACAICATPFCGECGRPSGPTFLCRDHASYEVYQGMARVRGTFDPVLVVFLRSCLEQEGFHPFVFSRKASTIHIGGPEYTSFMSSGDSPKVIVNEFKLLVPCPEVLEAEALLSRLDADSDRPTPEAAGPLPDGPTGSP